MDWNRMDEYLQIAIDKAVFFLPRIVAAGVILWVGFKIVRKIVELTKLGVSTDPTPRADGTIPTIPVPVMPDGGNGSNPGQGAGTDVAAVNDGANDEGPKPNDEPTDIDAVPAPQPLA